MNFGDRCENIGPCSYFIKNVKKMLHFMLTDVYNNHILRLL